VIAQSGTTFNTSSQIYRIVGDNSSVISVIQSLVSSCNINQTAPYVYQPTQYYNPNATDNSSLPRPEQIIQYYRASSFALSLDGYNNTMALSSNTPSSNTSQPANMTQTPLPTNLNQTFLDCLNSTIGNELPLVDPPQGLSTLEIQAIIAGSVFVAVLALFFIAKCFGYLEGYCGCCPSRKPQRKDTGSYSRLEQKYGFFDAVETLNEVWEPSDDTSTW
jgi:hypothetical protein